MNRDLVDLLDDLAAAKHDDLSVAADAAQEIRRLRTSLDDCAKRYRDLIYQLSAGADM